MAVPQIDLDELPYLVGRARIFGDGISVEQILPPRPRSGSLVDNAAMGGIDPEFVNHVNPGDFLVAGLDFGIGSATNETASALKRAGIAAVISRSFGNAFFCVAIEAGLPALQVEETGAIKTGDRLRVDIEGHKVVNLSSGDRYVIRNVYDETLDILRAGGRAEYTAATQATRKAMSHER